MQEKNLFDKIAIYIFIIGVVLVVYVILNSLLHNFLGSKIPKNILPSPTVVFPQ